MKLYYSDELVQLWHGDCRETWPTIEGGAACAAMSPPYNAGIDYDEHLDMMSWPDYREMAESVCRQTFAAMIVGGRVWINVTPVVPANPQRKSMYDKS